MGLDEAIWGGTHTALTLSLPNSEILALAMGENAGSTDEDPRVCPIKWKRRRAGPAKTNRAPNHPRT